MIKEFLTKKITRNRLEEFIAKYGSEEKLVLDLGCGESFYRRYFKNRIGFDVEKKEGVDVVGDAHNLPFEDNKFDMILCTEVLEHLHSPQVAIGEMKRVLKSGGLLILTTRFIYPLHETPGDYYRYTKYGLRHLFKDGWEIIELIEETSTKDAFAVLLQRIGFQTDLRGGVIIKAIVFLGAKIISFLPSLIKREFGSIKRTYEEKNILTSGYYLVGKKIQ